MTTSSSNIDYYSILEIPYNCSQEDIAEAYCHLSLKYHLKNNNPRKFSPIRISFPKII